MNLLLESGVNEPVWCEETHRVLQVKNTKVASPLILQYFPLGQSMAGATLFIFETVRKKDC